MIASNIMSAHPVSVRLEATVRDAVVLLARLGLHDLPVVDDKERPVGIITSRSILHYAVPAYASEDLLAIMRAGPDVNSVYKNLAEVADRPVAEVMDRNIQPVRHNMPTSAVAAMLINLKHDTHNVLVVDDEEKLVGIISARDIIRRILD